MLWITSGINTVEDCFPGPSRVLLQVRQSARTGITAVGSQVSSAGGRNRHIECDGQSATGLKRHLSGPEGEELLTMSQPVGDGGHSGAGDEASSYSVDSHDDSFDDVPLPPEPPVEDAPPEEYSFSQSSGLSLIHI